MVWGVGIAVGVDGARVTAASTVGGGVGVALGTRVAVGKVMGVGVASFPQAATRAAKMTAKLAPNTRRHLFATTLLLNGIPTANLRPHHLFRLVSNPVLANRPYPKTPKNFQQKQGYASAPLSSDRSLIRPCVQSKRA